MNSRQETIPDNKNKEIRSMLWFALIVILVFGILIAVYFIFISEKRLKIEDWKTYTNELFGYSFKYPANAKVVVDKPEQAVDIKGPEVQTERYWPRFYIATYNSDRYHPPRGVDVKEWVSEHFGYEEFGPDIIIANTPAVNVKGIKNKYDELADFYYFIHGGQMFEIQILHTMGMEDWDLYNAFLDSFTFS